MGGFHCLVLLQCVNTSSDMSDIYFQDCNIYLLSGRGRKCNDFPLFCHVVNSDDRES